VSHQIVISRPTLTVGQRLWYVPSDKRMASPFYITVLKVGRTWADCGNGRRINIETLRADGGSYSSPGTAWLSKEAYDADVALDACWRRFQCLAQANYSAPKGIRLSQIENAARALFGVSVIEKDKP
jgi:hypothetical protein